MTVQGKSAEFHSQPDFDAFRVEAFKQLGEDLGQFAHKWPRLADAAGRSKRQEVLPKAVVNQLPESAAAEPEQGPARRGGGRSNRGSGR